MHKLSGLILDLYDDKDGQILRDLYASEEEVPDFIKSASSVVDDIESLPDDVFALILVDRDYSLRKYACVDAGNTALNVEYFFRRGHLLPNEAQKVAAANLAVACSWYGLEPPADLEKVAGVGAMLGPAMSLMMLPQAAKEMKAGIATARQAGGKILTPSQMKGNIYQMVAGG